MTKTRLAQLLWLSVPHIGNQTFKKICQFSKRAEIDLMQLWENSGKYESSLSLNKRQQKSLNIFKKDVEAEKYLNQLRKLGIEIVLKGDEQYPKQFSGLDDMPAILFCKGNLQLLQAKKTIGIVGTRRITSYGKDVIQALLPQLVNENFVIVSGFMYGVDSAAHKQAIASQGKTIGVLGFGFEHMYPASNQQFAKEFLTTDNLLITEYPPPMGAHPGNFPRRNRIVAALSLGIVVVEAALKSGSHITAQYALEYGRLVGAVPGSIFNPYSEGTKELINQGAKLVSNAEDVLQELEFEMSAIKNFELGKQLEQQLNNLASPQEQEIFSQLIDGNKSTDELARKTKLPVTTVLVHLSLLELKKYIKKEAEAWRVNYCL